jgi:hypothetical protein
MAGVCCRVLPALRWQGSNRRREQLGNVKVCTLLHCICIAQAEILPAPSVACV